MTNRLRDAMVRVEQLPEAEQDAMPEMLLAELASDARWEQAIGSSSNQLQRMADQAWAEHEQGRSEPFDPDRL